VGNIRCRNCRVLGPVGFERCRIRFRYFWRRRTRAIHGLAGNCHQGLRRVAETHSVYGLSRTLGLGHMPALGAQIGFAAVIAVAVIALWRRPVPYELKAAGLAAACLLPPPMCSSMTFRSSRSRPHSCGANESSMFSNGACWPFAGCCCSWLHSMSGRLDSSPQLRCSLSHFVAFRCGRCHSFS
jgi:hypothetical protein